MISALWAEITPAGLSVAREAPWPASLRSLSKTLTRGPAPRATRVQWAFVEPEGCCARMHECREVMDDRERPYPRRDHKPKTPGLGAGGCWFGGEGGIDDFGRVGRNHPCGAASLRSLSKTLTRFVVPEGSHPRRDHKPKNPRPWGRGFLVWR